MYYNNLLSFIIANIKSCLIYILGILIYNFILFIDFLEVIEILFNLFRVLSILPINSKRFLLIFIVFRISFKKVFYLILVYYSVLPYLA